MPQFDLAGNPLPEPGTSAPVTPVSGQRPPASAPPPASTSTARYDLAGNPLPESAPPAPQAGNWVPPPQTGTSWPPPPSGGGAYAPQQARNDSGEKAGVPPEIARFQWNWGAWFWTWIWCFAMKMPLFGVAFLVLTVLGFVPIVNYVTGFVSLGLAIYLAVKGHGLAWQNRHFAGGVPEFIAVQRTWLKWGVGLFVVSLLIVPILAAILFPVFMQARMKAQMMNSGYHQPYGNGGTSNGSGQ